jgi:hypothetical protein
MESFAARRHAAALAIVAIAISVGILSWTLVTVANVNYGSPGLRTADGGNAAATAVETPNRTAKAGLPGTEFARPDFAAMDAFAPRMPSAAQPGGMDTRVWEADENPDWLRAGSLLASAPAREPAPSWPGEPAGRVDAASAAPAPAAETPVELPAPAPARLADSATPAIAGAHPSHEPKALRTAAPTHSATPPRPHKVAAAPRTYLEKVPEQGDAGDVSFRYRRRACTPGNMIDVCYMPEANRARIVVERW